MRQNRTGQTIAWNKLHILHVFRIAFVLRINLLTGTTADRLKAPTIKACAKPCQPFSSSQQHSTTPSGVPISGGSGHPPATSSAPPHSSAIPSIQQSGIRIREEVNLIILQICYFLNFKTIFQSCFRFCAKMILRRLGLGPGLKKV